MEIFVTRSSMPPFEEYVEEIRGLWESRWLTNMGSKHEELKKRLKERLQVPCLELLTNGHMALEITLLAMGLKPGGEIITTPFTFVSTTHAIVRSGFRPVFCDVDPKSCCLDPEKLTSLITDRTVAILPVHVYGNLCDTEAIGKIASRYGLKVLYDAAHAFGESIRGKSVAGEGDAACFSFHATKVFHTIEGGAVATGDEELSHRISLIRDFGIYDEERVTFVGPNAKMHEFSASMGLCNLRHLDEEIEKRSKVYERYREKLDHIPGLRIHTVQEGVASNYAYFPVFIDPEEFGMDRDSLFHRLSEEGIHPRKYFYPVTNAMECYRGQFDPGATPVADELSSRVLTLPMYADLAMEDVDRIAGVIRSLGSVHP